jgi:hypothetical protein
MVVGDNNTAVRVGHGGDVSGSGGGNNGGANTAVMC